MRAVSKRKRPAGLRQALRAFGFGVECAAMKFQTRQPQRLLESGRIVSSLDPRDYDSFRHWLFGQRWIGEILVWGIYALTALAVFAIGMATSWAMGYWSRLVSAS